MRFSRRCGPLRAARIQMSSLPAISDEDGAIATLQAIFPGVRVGRLKAVLRDMGAGSETTPMRPWAARVHWAIEHLVDEGEILDLEKAASLPAALPAAPPATPAAGTSLLTASSSASRSPPRSSSRSA